MAIGIYKDNNTTPVVPILNNGTNVYSPLMYLNGTEYTDKRNVHVQVGFFGSRYNPYANVCLNRYTDGFLYWHNDWILCEDVYKSTRIWKFYYE